MNRSEQIFDCAKRLVSLQEELNAYGVDTDHLVALVEEVAKKGIDTARKEIRGFGFGKYGAGDDFEFNFSEEEKLRWQQMAGITQQREERERKEQELKDLAEALEGKSVRIVRDDAGVFSSEHFSKLRTRIKEVFVPKFVPQNDFVPGEENLEPGYVIPKEEYTINPYLEESKAEKLADLADKLITGEE